MKKLLKEWRCRLFGHRMYEEVFAERRYSFVARSRMPLYRVVREHRCDRCDKCDRKILRSDIRRSQLLKEGWFIER
ncbi:hypothetical protein [uncultured Alistipes sp.]|uniref:hypothetical protein n=1 Tax=uncultured Alistipes sp. TaxID=538949 RepID=UPI00272AEC83|nr:hypothetical protein [uncultured Alistipes sp.]